MVGLNGTGKTRLACNILHELNTNGCLYLRQGTFTLEHRRSYGHRDVYVYTGRGRPDDYEDGPKTVWQIAQDETVLVLDEIGCKALSPDEMLLFDEVLKHRYDQRKPTVLVSNLPLNGTDERPGLKQFLGDALWDRIVSATGNGRFILQFSEASYRRQQGEDYLRGLKDQPL